MDALRSMASLLTMHCFVSVCCLCVHLLLFLLTEDSEPERDAKGIFPLSALLLLLRCTVYFGCLFS